MKVLNERISEWVHLYFYHKQFLRYLPLKFEKEVIFLERFSPYEVTESGDKIFLNSYLAISVEPLNRKS